MRGWWLEADVDGGLPLPCFACLAALFTVAAAAADSGARFLAELRLKATMPAAMAEPATTIHVVNRYFMLHLQLLGSAHTNQREREYVCHNIYNGARV